MREVFYETNKLMPVDEKSLNKLMTIYDVNNDKKISRKEFIKAVEMFL
jgi:Ca2+-binding EF-hand superfamily protein